MPRANRRDVLADGEVQVVHCVNRCVRRALLCGHDPLTGTDYERRRELIRQRMEFLAGVMGIEVLGYSVTGQRMGHPPFLRLEALFCKLLTACQVDICLVERLSGRI